MFDTDDKGWPVFPTRFGDHVGKSVERGMLDAVGGPNGIRTKIKTLPDGTTVMLRTRNGFPEFTVTQKVSTPTTSVQQLYFRLVGETHSRGVSLTLTNGTYVPSTAWDWPAQPVSYCGVSSAGGLISPETYPVANDGPGSNEWTDSRSTPDFSSRLTWNPYYSVGGRSGRYYGYKYLGYWTSTNHAEAASHADGYTLIWGSTSYGTPGFPLPGQSTARFIDTLTSTKLYSDGEYTGVSGSIIAACKHKKTDASVVYRTVEYNSLNAFYLREYDTDGALLSSISVNLYDYADFSATYTIRHPVCAMHFNSSGTQAACIYTLYAGTTYSTKVVLIDAETGVPSAGPCYGEVEYSKTGDTSIASWYNLTSSRTYSGQVVSKTSQPLFVDYVGDSLRVVWQKYTVVSTLSASYTYSSVGGVVTRILSGTVVEERERALYNNETVIEASANTKTVAVDYSAVQTYANSVYSWSGGGDASVTYSAPLLVYGAVCGDLRNSLYFYDKQAWYERTLSTAYTVSGATSTPTILSEYESGEQYSLFNFVARSGSAETSVFAPGTHFVDYAATSGSSTSSTHPTPLPTIYSGSTLVDNVNLWTTMQWGTGSSHGTEQFAFSVDQTGTHAVVSGLFVVNPPQNDPSTVTLDQFVAVNKVITLSSGATANLTMPSFGDTLVWMAEPMFMKKEVTT